MNNALGSKLKEYRLRTGIGTRKLAQRTSITRRYICRLESGKKKNPTIEIVKKLAVALNCKTGDLID